MRDERVGCPDLLAKRFFIPMRDEAHVIGTEAVDEAAMQIAKNFAHDGGPFGRDAAGEPNGGAVVALELAPEAQAVVALPRADAVTHDQLILRNRCEVPLGGDVLRDLQHVGELAGHLERVCLGPVG